MSAPATLPTVEDLLADLDAERAVLTDMVRELPRSAGARSPWDTPTRAVPWTVRDQIAHLGWFDAAFSRAMSTPDDFVAERDAITDLDGFVDRANDTVPTDGPAALAWWQDAAAAFDRAAREVAARDPKARLPWYGPPMSLRSAITSRIMETWAHGLDVADALGVHVEPTDRLRHVADLAVRARPQGYRVRGLAVPGTPVHVELTGPGGAVWTWADVSEAASLTFSVSDAASLTSDTIRGRAEEFCLVLARRRHVDDTSLLVTGEAAREWMLVGQVFAGSPGTDPERVSGIS